MTKTLESLLRERLSDSRAMIAALDINHDRVLLHFGAIGDLARITLSVDDNEISIATPDELAKAWALEDLGKRSRTPLDPAVPLKAVLLDGVIRIANGPEIEVFAADGETRVALDARAESEPGQTAEFVSFPKGGPIAAVFADDKLTAGDGGPEIELPESFYEYVASALLTEEGDEADPGAGDGAQAARTGADGETPAKDGEGANGANGGESAPVKNAGVWINFDSHKLDDLKAIAADEGVELAPEDTTKRLIAEKINAKRGAARPAN